MPAKPTSKNPRTQSQDFVEQVRTADRSTVLTPMKLGSLEAVQKKPADLGIAERDIGKAVTWSRKQYSAGR